MNRFVKNIAQYSVINNSNNVRPGWLNENNRRTPLASNQHINQINVNESQDTTVMNETEQYVTQNEIDQQFRDYYQSMYREQSDSISTIHSNAYKQSRALIEVNCSQLDAILDTGATSCMQNYKTYLKLRNKPELVPYKGQAYSYGSSISIPVIGQYQANISCSK